MLRAVADEKKIRNMREATEARKRAIPTGSAIVRLHEELMRRPGLSQRERADKEREIDRLRAQHKREMEPIEAFHKELERRGEEFERRRGKVADKAK